VAIEGRKSGAGELAAYPSKLEKRAPSTDEERAVTV
jgi:hypothetical protein